MTWNLLTVSIGDKKYQRGQNFLSKLARKSGINHLVFTENSLLGSSVYKENKKWFSKKNHYGWFAWKPLFLLKAMEKLNEGDKILYIDSLDIFHPDIFRFVDELMDENDPCLLPMGNSRNGDYTKRD